VLLLLSIVGISATLALTVAHNGETTADHRLFQRLYKFIKTLYVHTHCRKFMPNRTSYDHACVSAYNWGDDKSGGYKAFEEVFTFAYNNLANVTDAPLGLCEGSTVGAGGNKTQWYMDAVDTLKSLPRCTQAHWFLINVNVSVSITYTTK
jgi:hypothetical protein